MLDFTRFKVLTFDCYGTLIDWEAGILRAVRPVLVRHGVEAGDREILETYAELEAKHEEGEFVRYSMVLRLVMTEMSLRFGFDAKPVELECLSRSVGEWDPFTDTVDALRRLKSRYKLAVISNVEERLFDATARRLDVPFDWVITAERVGAYKPSPKIFLEAFDAIGRDRNEIVHVAQSTYHDILPAKGLGLATVWVNRRAGKTGSGATLPASARADIEVPDLASLARMAGVLR